MKWFLNLATAICILHFTSCIEALEWDDEIQPTGTIIVEGLITDESGPHTVRLSRTQPVIVDGPGQGVSGAIVTIADGSTEYDLREAAPGIYETDAEFSGQVGKTYTLRIEIDNEVYTATSKMPAVDPLSAIEFRPWAGDPSNPEGIQYFEFTYRSNFGVPTPYNYSIHLEMPENVREFYPPQWEMPSWVERRLASGDHVLIDSSYYLHASIEPPALFAYGESTYAGFTYGSIITEKFLSITPKHYDFIRAVLSETDWKGLGPFGYIPADVPTNLSNGAKGWFATSAVATVETVVE